MDGKMKAQTSKQRKDGKSEPENSDFSPDF
jgi:hypothetical protein